MQFKVRTAAEIAELAVSKILRKGGGREATVYIPAYHLPPTRRAYRWETHETPLGTVKMLAFPSERGGWVVKVRFNTPITFNSPIPPEQGKALLERLTQGQK